MNRHRIVNSSANFGLIASSTLVKDLKSNSSEWNLFRDLTGLRPEALSMIGDYFKRETVLYPSTNSRSVGIIRCDEHYFSIDADWAQESTSLIRAVKIPEARR